MENNFDIVVQKFGGSSVAKPEAIKQVALFIKNRLASIERICVVVSAMGNTTNDLIKLAKEVNADPSKRELDMLISCGERSSMALLAMALHGQGVSAISMTGSQSGIITDDNHNGAQIVAIRPERIIGALKTHQVVLVAGFQGMSRQKEITTLKRGGSDTTAVAMTAALKAKACEIYTDVPGVMDIDPNVVSLAQVMPVVSPDQMCAMSLYGAKVMAYDAARLAHNLGIEILIAKSGALSEGTKVHEINVAGQPLKRVGAITHLRAVVQLSIPLSLCRDFNAGYFLCAHLKGDSLLAYGSNDLSQEHTGEGIKVEGGLGLISVHLNEQADIAISFSLVAELLDENNIRLEDAILGYKQITLVIHDQDMNRSLEILYRGLKGLGERA